MIKLYLKRLACIVIAYAVAISICVGAAYCLPNWSIFVLGIIALATWAYPRHKYYLAIMKPNEEKNDVLMLYKTYKRRDSCNKFIDAYPEYKLVCCNEITRGLYKVLLKDEKAVIIND